MAVPKTIPYRPPYAGGPITAVGQTKFSSAAMQAPTALLGGGGGVPSAGGGYAGVALLATSLISTMIGTSMEAKAAKAEARAIQAAAEYNANMAEREGRAKEARIRHLARRNLSSWFTQMAGKSGVIAEEGGWLEALVWNAAAYETDALNAAIAGRNTAALERSRGQAAKRIGKQRSAAQYIAGAGKVAGMGLSLGIGGSYPTVAEIPGTTGGTSA